MFDRVIITGAGGWIGQAATAWHARRFGPDWREHVTLFGAAARTTAAEDGPVEVRALRDVCAADVTGALVLHLAYLTKEKTATLSEAEFVAINTAIDDQVLAACAKGGARAVFVASSGAVAAVAQGRSRELYGLTKLKQEERFAAFARSGPPVLIGRIFNIAGPYINKLGDYAIGSFITQALSQGRIEIAARTPVYRSFLHVEDLLAVVYATLQAGTAPAGPVDLCGPHIVEMQDLAEAVAEAVGLSPASISRGPIDYASPSVYLGDPCATRTLALAAGLPLRDFPTQVRDTVDYVRKSRD